MTELSFPAIIDTLFVYYRFTMILLLLCLGLIFDSLCSSTSIMVIM